MIGEISREVKETRARKVYAYTKRTAVASSGNIWFWRLTLIPGIHRSTELAINGALLKGIVELYPNSKLSNANFLELFNYELRTRLAEDGGLLGILIPWLSSVEHSQQATWRVGTMTAIGCILQDTSAEELKALASAYFGAALQKPSEMEASERLFLAMQLGGLLATVMMASSGTAPVIAAIKAGTAIVRHNKFDSWLQSILLQKGHPDEEIFVKFLLALDSEGTVHERLSRAVDVLS